MSKRREETSHISLIATKWVGVKRIVSEVLNGIWTLVEGNLTSWLGRDLIPIRVSHRRSSVEGIENVCRVHACLLEDLKREISAIVSMVKSTVITLSTVAKVKELATS